MRILFLLAALMFVVAPAQAAAVKTETLVIETAKGEQVFKVEVVREEKDRNRGLMYRKRMADNRGMLFDYDPPQDVAFWMKNTYISLDIIFVDATGKIITIAAKTKPLSLDRIPSNGVARGVLEIKGGFAEKLGIKVGDRVRHQMFEAK
jgi:uncharacterized membrane protein (UPF0127 family)